MKAFLKALNITPYSVMFNALFFAGMLLTIWEIDIYQHTFIDYRVPTLLWIGPGLCLTPALRKILAVYINTSSLFLQLIYNIVTWGGIVVFSVMALNFYFAEQNTTLYTLRIKDVKEIPGGRNHCMEPNAVVEWMGREKDIAFPCGTSIEPADSVKLNLKEGFLGYTVMVNKELVLAP